MATLSPIADYHSADLATPSNTNSQPPTAHFWKFVESCCKAVPVERSLMTHHIERDEMKHVVLVAPYFGPTMRTCLNAFANLRGVRLGLISNQPREAIPGSLTHKIHGHYRVGNALNPDHLERACRGFAAEWGRIDRLIGYLEHLQGPMAEVRSRLDLPGMKREAARNFRDKNTMKRTLRDAGLPVARQKRVTSGDDASRFIEAVGYPVVLKPLAGVGSKNTLRVANEDDLFAALNLLLPSEDNSIQAEQFVQGEEHTLEAVTINGETVWQSSTYYLPGPLKVIENPWMQYCVLLPREQTPRHVGAFAPINERALNALGMETGLSHMEWFSTAQSGPVISEVGARPPGVNIMPMMGHAHGVDMWQKWAELMVHDTWEMPPRRAAVGCAFLRAQGRGQRVTAVHGLLEAQAGVEGMVLEARLPHVGQLRSAHYEGEGYVMISAPDTERVVQGLRHIISNVRVIAG